MDVPQFIAGRFRIEREIGRGGMGTVYLATPGIRASGCCKDHQARVCGRSRCRRSIFARSKNDGEAATSACRNDFRRWKPAGWSPLHHHGVCGRGNTFQALAREGRFSFSQAVQIATQVTMYSMKRIASASFTGSETSNIILSERGVCVLDFGVARFSRQRQNQRPHVSTGSGQLVGTPRYMSPEQCLGQRVGARMISTVSVSCYMKCLRDVRRLLTHCSRLY